MDRPIHSDVDEVCNEFGRLVRAGTSISVESILKSQPQLAHDPETVLDLIYEEFTARLEMQQHALVEEYFNRFPELRDQLQKQFDLHRALVSADVAGYQPPLAGSRLLHFDLLEELGRGGSGVVFLAWDSHEERMVALKLLLGKTLDACHGERRVASVRHPNLRGVHGFGEQSEFSYLVLEYVEGGTLAARLRDRRYAPVEAATLMLKIARAVDCLHRHNILHRDLAPNNVLLTQAGEPKLSDFGLACRIGEKGLSADGTIVGTPAYMAPEQITGTVPVGLASDIFSLGVMLYELLTGAPPFGGKTVLQTLGEALIKPVVPPRRVSPLVPADLEAICLRCLKRAPRQRFASASELVSALEAFVAEQAADNAKASRLAFARPHMRGV